MPAAPTESASPPHPDLAPAQALFARGDFRNARQELNRLLAAAPSPELAAEARTLMANLTTDPWALRLGLAALAVLLLTALTYLH